MDFSKLNNRFIRHVNVPSNLGTIEPASGCALGVGQCGDSIEVTLKVVDVKEKPSDAHI
jgi:NifU-like protein involved in Fe-S cluster formation